jgi:hypothetical protein
MNAAMVVMTKKLRISNLPCLAAEPRFTARMID